MKVVKDRWNHDFSVFSDRGWEKMESHGRDCYSDPIEICGVGELQELIGYLILHGKDIARVEG